jgi:tetraacyldisaccharide 4'-kinase
MVLYVRHFLYDKGILKSYGFDFPVITVGNLNIGGAGKTPFTEYLVNVMLQNGIRPAVLSRGYKRSTSGFIVADENSTPELIGDEPYQMFHKFGKRIILAVDENRVEGIQRLYEKFRPEVVILDDAFQHRRLKEGLRILLTPFAKPFYEDSLFPAGNLRDLQSRVRSADLIVVTKVPQNAKREKKEKILHYLKKMSKPVYFASFKYGNPVKDKKPEDWNIFYGKKILVVTGVANPEPLFDFLKSKNLNFEKLVFPDHAVYNAKQIARIERMKIESGADFVLTTEKDYHKIKNRIAPLYYVPVGFEPDNEKELNKKIINYVETGKFI